MLGVLAAQAAEVDDALDVRRGLGEVDRGLAVLGGEVAAGAHRVDEVIGGVDALAAPRAGPLPESTSPLRASPFPAPRRERVRTLLAAGEQFVDELGADIAGGTGDEDHERFGLPRGESGSHAAP